LVIYHSNDENNGLSLRFEKEVEDVRGKILFLSYGDEKINFVEIKKGFARGGHYHKIAQYHIIISGKFKYSEENVKTGQEQIKIVTAPAIIHVPPDTAHLLTAIEDTLFVETFKKELEATIYPKYRKIVEERMKVVH
jgi:quercetin dioxygenase-like cupin family protein